jgi:DNA polymerase-4
MAALGIATGADLRAKDLPFLREHFGALADYLYRAARGIDLRRVRPNRPRKSVGSERTFERDISTGPGLREALARIIDLAWSDIEKTGARGRTVTLKLRLSDFTLRTHARSMARAVEGREEFARLAEGLLDQVLPLPQSVRLMGLTLSALEKKGAVVEVVPVVGGGQLDLF